MGSPPPAGFPRISPYLNYEDTAAMIEWLGRAFGGRLRHATRDRSGAVTHAEVEIEDSLVMVGTPSPEFRNPRRLGAATQSLYVYVDDVDAHHTRAVAAGAVVTESPADQPYGDRRYGVEDPEGHRWYFASRLAE